MLFVKWQMLVVRCRGSNFKYPISTTNYQLRDIKQVVVFNLKLGRCDYSYYENDHRDYRIGVIINNNNNSYLIIRMIRIVWSVLITFLKQAYLGVPYSEIQAELG